MASVRETGMSSSPTSSSSCRVVNSKSLRPNSWFYSQYILKTNMWEIKAKNESVPAVPSSVACSLKTWTQIRKAGQLLPAQRSRWESKVKVKQQNFYFFIYFFPSLKAGNKKYSFLRWIWTVNWSGPGVLDRDKQMIWWTRWWNALRTISAVLNQMKPKDQKTGKRAGLYPLWDHHSHMCSNMWEKINMDSGVPSVLKG